MSDFDYTQHGSDTLSEPEKESLIADARQEWVEVGFAKEDGTVNSAYGERAQWQLGAISSALREIDRLRAELAALKKCSLCGGKGEVWATATDWVACPRCHGNGQDW